MKELFLVLLICSINISISYSQINENRYNVNYATTSLFDDFSSGLNTVIWNVNARTISGTGVNDNPFIYVDSLCTVHIDSVERLQLSMINYPNYTTTDWLNNPISANYITGGIISRQHFSYGIFECNAQFAHNLGSFPAFWLMSAEQCSLSYNNEIDIVECKVQSVNNIKLQNNLFY